MSDVREEGADPRLKVGCCGAYCKTCGVIKEGACRGCKLGYENGERDINKSKCKIKVCCFRDKKLMTCADCAELSTCRTINDFYGKNGHKYKKYQEAVEFIRKNGYARFAEVAAGWKNAYGRYDKN
jgi:hypothetical protein